MAFQNVVGVRLGQGAVTTSYTTFYTTPANTRTYVKDFDLCNTTGAPVYMYVSLVNAGDTVGTDNSILYNTLVAPYSTVQWSGTQIMNAGGTIQAKASAAGCTLTVSGGEAT